MISVRPPAVNPGSARPSLSISATDSAPSPV
jgi:hypothetical protein